MNLYNDIDPKCCAWTQELINAGLIPPGDVVCKSILDIKPHELEKYTQVHLFCGIAGWPYALRLAGWPDDRPIITASAPCQPLSCAGKRKGHADERHLWPALYALIAECRFPICIGEQVASADGREWLSGVRADLEGAGYALGCANLCAAGASAPHIRQRLFYCAVRLAHTGGSRADVCAEKVRARDGSSGESSGDGRLADTEPQHDGSGQPRQGRRREPSDHGAGGGLAHSKCDGRGERAAPAPRCESGTALFDDRGAAGGGMGDTGNARSQGLDQRCGDGNQSGRLDKDETGHSRQAGEAGFWSNSRWHPCRDGKARRVPTPSGVQFVAPGLSDLMAALRDAGCPEAEIRQACDLFPLSKEKISGRVMLLRGAGNAICALVAAEFIRAVMDCLENRCEAPRKA